jgi:hypothetical protein
MKRRNLILLLGGTGSAALSTGTGAFSSASADRSVEVSVVEDENAYVGYMALPEVEEDEEQGGGGQDKKSMTVEDGDRVTLLRVANRFPENSGIGIVGIEFADNEDLFTNLAVELSADDEYEQMADNQVRSGPYEAGGPVPDEHAFGPGDYASVTADVHGEPGPYDIEITIRVRGTEDTGVSASIFGDTRVFELHLTDPQPNAADINNVIFNGNGNAETDPKGVGKVRAEARFGATGSNSPYTVTDIQWDTSKKLKSEITNGGGKLLAVRFPETNRTFVNPNETNDLNDSDLPGDWENREWGDSNGS